MQIGYNPTLCNSIVRQGGRQQACFGNKDEQGSRYIDDRYINEHFQRDLVQNTTEAKRAAILRNVSGMNHTHSFQDYYSGIEKGPMYKQMQGLFHFRKIASILVRYIKKTSNFPKCTETQFQRYDCGIEKELFGAINKAALTIRIAHKLVKKSKKCIS